jgi:hypothetical protein
MHTSPFVPLLVMTLLASALPACIADPDEDLVAAEDLTDADLATKALVAMGAKLPGTPAGHTGNCGSCHATNNRTTFMKWKERYDATMLVLADERKSKDERVRYMLRDPQRPEGGFDPAKVGILTAGANLGLAPAVNRSKHPLAYAQNELLSDVGPRGLFVGKPELLKRFRSDMLMPVEGNFDRMSAFEFEATLTWMKKGMPQLRELIADEGRPTTCTDDFAKLKSHASAIKRRSWGALNQERQLAMFACPPAAEPSKCFMQQSQGKDIFPLAVTQAFGKTWAPAGTNVRILQDLGAQNTFYWSRTSADGRFFASGGSGGTSFIVDLQARMADPLAMRIISAKANYDPDFFPDNGSFMFQGTHRGGVVCPQSVLTKPGVNLITFDEPGCNKLDNVALYQTVAQARGDNTLSDLFIINNKFASDNPALTSSTRDLFLSAGPDAMVRVAVAYSQGSEAGYLVKEVGEMPLPFHGDTMASRSLELLGSRIAGETKALGYALTRVKAEKGPAGYRFALEPAGRICMEGNKANFSFDERFLVTHHYLTREDFASDLEFAPFKDKGAADLYLADFVTGKKMRITRMSTGQFALFPHFRSDGWLMFEVRDAVQKKVFVVASDAAVQAVKNVPTP